MADTHQIDRQEDACASGCWLFYFVDTIIYTKEILVAMIFWL
jgi:hypothetical protein